MNSQKKITLFCCLLLWGSLLCACCIQKAEQFLNTTQSHPSGDSMERLSGQVAGDSEAWLEQSVPPGAAASAEHALPLLLLAYGLLFSSFRRLSLKSAKAKLGFASLAAQFRILPNAP